jgi:hypothetical protein
MFTPEFYESVGSGHKRHTFRPTCRCKPGDVMSLRRWRGKPFRSKQRELNLGVCISVLSLTIDWTGAVLGGNVLTVPECNRLARADGFHDYEDMLNYFDDRNGIPMSGWFYEWEPAGKELCRKKR